MHPMSTDIGAVLAARYANAGTTVTAGGTGDATEVNGAWIDRRGFSSLKVVIAYTATLSATKTLAIAANLQEASDSNGTGAADFGAPLASTVQATGETGGSTETGVVELDYDLTTANSHVRVQFTPDLDAAGTDTAALSSVYILGGATEVPVTATAV